MPKFCRYAQAALWATMLLYALIAVYGKVRTEMERQLPCQPVTSEVRHAR